MTKIGLRDWILLITLVPTLLISLGLGGYFSFARYQDLQHYLEEQASNIAEPLAIASEQGILSRNKAQLQRLLNVSHRKNSPLVKSIAIFDHQRSMLATSNYHKDFARLMEIVKQPWPEHSEILDDGARLVILVPVVLEGSAIEELALSTDDNALLIEQLLNTQGKLALVLVEIQKDKVVRNYQNLKQNSNVFLKIYCNLNMVHYI